ncbi:hypothetical protein [Lachnospira hominis (ex Liu et al. 2021)]|uniref:Transposase n=1 Tax=Lachnospira hominis (ex Liu et al. 2021) TaxID=2763051 RepID=A0ABR7G1Z7_9FIRM|nr:hypothetical protein [Lachnospira hominis]MBC5681461.1 hypothetical protein [Lachnospira hominis]
MSNIIEGITKDLKAIPKNLKAKAGGMDTKKLVLLNLTYIFAGYKMSRPNVQKILYKNVQLVCLS